MFTLQHSCYRKHDFIPVVFHPSDSRSRGDNLASKRCGKRTTGISPTSYWPWKLPSSTGCIYLPAVVAVRSKIMIDNAINMSHYPIMHTSIINDRPGYQNTEVSGIKMLYIIYLFGLVVPDSFPPHWILECFINFIFIPLSMLFSVYYSFKHTITTFRHVTLFRFIICSCLKVHSWITELQQYICIRFRQCSVKIKFPDKSVTCY